MTLEEMRARKAELGYSNQQIAELSGVPLGTVMKIFGGATKRPRYETIQALERVLSKPSAYPEEGRYATRLRESQANYFDSANRKYTVDDYLRLPDDQRVELIDGKFFEMQSPSYQHQDVSAEIFVQIRQCIRQHAAACRVFMAPCDVQLDRDAYTMVQPDVMILCDMEKLYLNVCYGAPDLIVEVLSPSTSSRDCVLKLNKYKAAGVREYWIVDADNETVMVYDFKEDGRYRSYSFDDRVPIGIAGSETCHVDFSEIKETIAIYKENPSMSTN